MNNLQKIKIVDARMGQGKTSWAISKMNNDVEGKYIYITPFLNEVKRIREQCTNKKFKEPLNFGNGKQDNLHELLLNGSDISSTHALFRASNEVTRELISCGEYTLILDEVMDVVEQVKLKKDDIPSMIELNLISISGNGTVYWNDEKMDYDGKYNDVKAMAMNNTLVLIGDTMLMWNFPINVFEAFKEVYIMTYMFNSQVQRYYYDLFNLPYQYCTIKNERGEYVLVNLESYHDLKLYDDRKELIELINVLEHDKLNLVGDKKTSLSSTWFSANGKNELIKVLKNNLNNYIRNINNAKSEDVIWTTFKASETKLRGKGFTKSFIPCNIRATNEYSDRHILAYCVNIFLNPIVASYFTDRGVEIDEDGYALSEMLQWIWRSAIRKGEKVDIYIPSSRMRNLLLEYIYQ